MVGWEPGPAGGPGRPLDLAALGGRVSEPAAEGSAQLSECVCARGERAGWVRDAPYSGSNKGA